MIKNQNFGLHCGAPFLLPMESLTMHSASHNSYFEEQLDLRKSVYFMTLLGILECRVPLAFVQ